MSKITPAAANGLIAYYQLKKVKQKFLGALIVLGQIKNYDGASVLARDGYSAAYGRFEALLQGHIIQKIKLEEHF